MMTKSLEIRLTASGVDVVAGERSTSFGHVEDAVAYVKDHLARAQALRELSARCE
jgi:hypothetical protein